MEDYTTIQKTISIEITQDIPDVRESFIKKYDNQVNKFIDEMSHAFLKWRSLDSGTDEDEKKAHVSALVFSAINLHIVSMKLFLSGYIVAAGNLQRQILETIALAILCSSKSLDVLERYIQNKYSTKNAVRDVRKHAKKLNLKKDILEGLKQARDFFHVYSHPTFLTIGSNISFKGLGLYLGASFDEGKIEFYDKEIAGRISLSGILSNFVDGIKTNIRGW